MGRDDGDRHTFQRLNRRFEWLITFKRQEDPIDGIRRIVIFGSNHLPLRKQNREVG